MQALNHLNCDRIKQGVPWSFFKKNPVKNDQYIQGTPWNKGVTTL